jgi:nucleotidyltransferase/DNA polymerase involved in DNA repair
MIICIICLLASLIVCTATSCSLFLVIAPDCLQDFLAPLPVRCLTGVGYKTEAALRSHHGLTTVGQLRQLRQQELVQSLGAKAGEGAGGG